MLCLCPLVFKYGLLNGVVCLTPMEFPSQVAKCQSGQWIKCLTFTAPSKSRLWLGWTCYLTPKKQAEHGYLNMVSGIRWGELDLDLWTQGSELFGSPFPSTRLHLGCEAEAFIQSALHRFIETFTHRRQSQPCRATAISLRAVRERCLAQGHLGTRRSSE